MSKLVYRHDRAGYTGELRFSITSDAEYGAVGTQGVGAARNLPDGLIDAQGYARASAGGDYVMAGAVPGVNVLPPMHRLTVRRGSTPVASVGFRPVETSPGVIDVVQLIQSGAALALTPEQATTVQGLISEFDRATLDLSGEKAVVAQAVTQLSQQQEGNNAQAAMNIGRRTALKVALISGAAGLYNIVSGQEAGQVWERKEDGTTERRPDLEAASAIQLAALRSQIQVTRSTLAAIPPTAQTALIDGVAYVRDDDAVPDGGSVLAVPGGAMRRASRRGVDLRDYIQPLTKAQAKVATAQQRAEYSRLIQLAANACAPGENLLILPGATPTQQFYPFTSLILPAGVGLQAEGGILWDGDVYLSKSLGQEFNSTITGHYKRTRFVLNSDVGPSTGPIDWINGVFFDRVLLDGTDLDDQGSTPKEAVLLQKNAFDVHLTAAVIHNYSAGLVQRCDDGTGKAQLATGVFITVSQSKLFNMSYGVFLDHAPLDGSDLRLSDVLLDHLGIGIVALNNPRLKDGGEILVTGSNIRMELCDQAIYNDGAYIDLDGVWSYGNPDSNKPVIETTAEGRTTINGRQSAPAGKTWASSPYSSKSVSAGLLGGGNQSGQHTYPLTRELTFNNLMMMRFRVEGVPGGTTLRHRTDEGRSWGSFPLSTDPTAVMTLGGPAMTVGVGEAALTYKWEGPGTLTIRLPHPIGAAVQPRMTGTNAGAHIVVDSRQQAQVYAVITFVDLAGEQVGVAALAEGRYVEFEVTFAL